jgi:hypothetical protein
MIHFLKKSTLTAKLFLRPKHNSKGDFFMNKNKLHAIGIAVVLLAAALVLTGCPDPNNATASQTVEAKYRFSGGVWIEIDGVNQVFVEDAVSALGENSFTVTGGGVSIAYAGVYTAGGGTHNINDESGTWAYLYASTGKIGIVYIHSDVYVVVDIGKTLSERDMAAFIEQEVEFVPPPDTAGMQDTHNGSAIYQRF